MRPAPHVGFEFENPHDLSDPGYPVASVWITPDMDRRMPANFGDFAYVRLLAMIRNDPRYEGWVDHIRRQGHFIRERITRVVVPPDEYGHDERVEWRLYHMDGGPIVGEMPAAAIVRDEIVAKA
jgi:hypothetical protein